MALQRNQPSPERQSVLSFVSPSVADLLFYETVDAKTVGAGSATTITITRVDWASTGISVPAGTHEAGYILTVFTDGTHGFVAGDVVTIEGLGSREDDSAYSRPNGTHRVVAGLANDRFTYFVREQPDAASPLDVTNNPRVYKAHPSYGTAHPDTENFSNHKLCYVKQADPNGLFFQYYYAAERHHQDDYNFEFSQADLGGNKYDTVVRTYVNLRSDFSDTDGEYQAGDAMPATPAYTFGNPYILMTRQQKRIGDQELDSIFVVEQRVYFHRVDIVEQQLDAATGGILSTVEKVVYRGESFNPPNDGAGLIEVITQQADYADWGLDAAGRNWEAEQLSHDWWKITIQDVIPQGSATHAGTSSKIIRFYHTYINFSWPAVFDSIFFNPVFLKNGTTKNVVTVRNRQGKDAFTGPTKALITQYWKSIPFTDTAAGLQHADVKIDSTKYPFKTSTSSYAGVQFSVSATNVLCEAQDVTDFIGTNHPVFKTADYGFPKPWLKASTPTDWPSSKFVVSSTQKPFRGGYLLEVTEVYPP